MISENKKYLFEAILCLCVRTKNMFEHIFAHRVSIFETIKHEPQSLTPEIKLTAGCFCARARVPSAAGARPLTSIMGFTYKKHGFMWLLFLAGAAGMLHKTSRPYDPSVLPPDETWLPFRVFFYIIVQKNIFQ